MILVIFIILIIVITGYLVYEFLLKEKDNSITTTMVPIRTFNPIITNTLTSITTRTPITTTLIPTTTTPTITTTQIPKTTKLESGVDCQVGNWSDWGNCSANCGGGIQERTRSIITQPKGNGKVCPELRETKVCNTELCNVDCKVSDWSDWSYCDVDCGGGIQERTRSIITQPKGNGKVCPELRETKACNTEPCGVDCQVGNWSNWSDCTASCGGGIQSRTRSIITQPKGTGKACPTIRETKECNTEQCNVDCQVGEWSNWAACSSNCGSASQERTRIILTQPIGKGKACPELRETRMVNWVICGQQDNKLMIGYSYDGKTWNPVNNFNSINGELKSVAFNGKMWVMVGQNIILNSTDGINWNKIDFFGILNEVCWTGSAWFVAGSGLNFFNGASIANIFTSTDGISWSLSFSNNNLLYTSFSTIAYNPSNKTLVAAGGRNIYYKKEGLNWTPANTDVVYDNGIIKITVINSKFVATVMSNRANLIYSSDGINWMVYNNTIPWNIMSNPNKILFYKDKLIVGGFGVNQLAYSNNNGNNWYDILQSYNSLNITNYIASNNDLIIAVGYDRNSSNGQKSVGQILTSRDGVSWSLADGASWLSTGNYNMIFAIASNIPL